MNKEKSVEEYRSAVILLKKQYKQLANDHIRLQTNIKSMESNKGKGNIFSLVKAAQNLITNVTKLQSMLRGSFSRDKIKQMKEKLANASKIKMSVQEKYLKRVKASTSDEFITFLSSFKSYLQDQHGVSIHLEINTYGKA